MNNETKIRITIAELMGYRLYQEQRGEYLLQFILRPGARMPWESVQPHAREEMKARIKFLDWSEFNQGSIYSMNVLPDYTKDLNAVQKAVEVLIAPNIMMLTTFAARLAQLAPQPLLAKPHQWCQALLDTIEAFKAQPQ